MTPARAGVCALAAMLAVLMVAAVPLAVPLGWSVLLSVPAGAVTALGCLLAHPAEPVWQRPPDPPATTTELQVSLLSSRLAEAAHDQRRFDSRVRPRLVALALAGLRARPETRDLTDLDDPRAAAALDPRLYDLLTRPTATLPDPRTLAALITTLENR